MKKVLKGFLSLGLAIAMCFGIVAIERSVVTEFNVAYAAEGSYYSSITAKSGTALLGQLHDLMTKTHSTYTSYTDCKTPEKVMRTDPGTESNTVRDFYTQENISSKWDGNSAGTWNREHVWCQSLSNGLWGESGGGSDMHHLRPSEVRLNGTRGNHTFGLATGGTAAYYKDTSGNNKYLGGYVKGDTFEPLDKVKGDVARIVMYVYMHYNKASNVGGSSNDRSYFGTLTFTKIMSASTESAAINMLLDWNKNDPVDEIEKTRNEAVYAIQGNRNPFIDNSGYADAIWGGGTVTPDPSVELKSLAISPASVSLTVGQTKTLSVTATPSNASNSVSWSTSNSAVATVSNGVVTAKAEGTTTITATSTINSNIKATATVTVTKLSSPSTGGTSGTIKIDRNSFSASGSYGAHTWTSGGVSGTAYIYGGESGMIQLNSSKSSHYLASSTATSSPIVSVTMTLNSDKHETGGKKWKLLTSTSAYRSYESGNPEDGNNRGIQTATKDGVTWTISGNDTYFALVYEDSGACYIDNIVLTYSGSDVGGGDEQHVCGHVCDTCHKCTDKNCTDPVCSKKCTGHGGGQPGGDKVKLQAFHQAVESIVSNGTLTQRLESINQAIIAYRALSEEDKALATEDIAALQAAISDYNQTVGAYNDEFGVANGAVNGGAKR